MAIVRDPIFDAPAEALPVLTIIADSLEPLQTRMTVLDGQIAQRAKDDAVAKRLMEIPGGPHGR